MKSLEFILNRRTVRVFKRRPLTDEEIRALITVACYAPAGGNVSLWEVIVVRGNSLKERLANVSLNQEFIGTAGATFVFFGGREHNVSAAIENLLLAAHVLGLEGCWVGSFSREKVAEILNIPREKPINAIVAVGVPDEPATNPGKRFPEEVMHLEKYGERKVSRELLKMILDQAREKVQEFRRLLRELEEKHGAESYHVYRLEEKYSAFVFAPILSRIEKVLRELNLSPKLADRIKEEVAGYRRGRGERLHKTGDINSLEVVLWERKYSREIFPKLIEEISSEIESLLNVS
ncbi:MAG: hypothetical protein DRJ51_06360 [Thermoprotei archaeon]|nr:MAG: hypothetical protein DRJ51_06360 [Thermoprotei archaeon]RLF00030.1 MAG: hypothetical protein DRJ59_07525 [Thermoprotei archaeon]